MASDVNLMFGKGELFTKHLHVLNENWNLILCRLQEP